MGLPSGGQPAPMADLEIHRAVNTTELLRRLGVNVPGSPALQQATASRTPSPHRDPFAPPRETLPRKVLHILNGDCAADQLRESGVPGTITITADVLHEGPAPAGVPPERWRKIRARYLAESGYDDYERCLATLTEWDRTMERAEEYEEVVLWFEHDLFDQLLLIRTLDWFADRSLGRTALSLICIGEFPGVEPFHGLGQLSPAQMASLVPGRRPVNEAQKLLARDAWRAFCAPDPRGLEDLLRRDTSPLPFLAGALRRHLEEFPSVRNGLSRTEHQALLGAAAGHGTFEKLFRATQRMEERVFLGDSSFLRNLRVLASGPRPLLRLEPASNGSLRSIGISLTATAWDVLESRDDWVHIQGIDRWLGGVHLQGGEALWRWDGEEGRLVERKDS
jgi:hypothetical protein